MEHSWLHSCNFHVVCEIIVFFAYNSIVKNQCKSIKGCFDALNFFPVAYHTIPTLTDRQRACVCVRVCPCVHLCVCVRACVFGS